MFWKYNNPSSSEIEALLQKQDVTLQEVMDSEDIINECRVQKKPLIDFLLKPEMIEELVNLTTREPHTDLEESIRFKYPNIACELLTSDVPAINERLASDEILLNKLYSFLECDPPLNPLLASYFSKIMGALIAKKAEQVLDFLKAKDTFITLLLKHLGTSAIMDLMLKLMTQVESVEMRQNILNWLDSQRIMQLLVGLLSSKVDKERHYNVAQLLCDFIVTARDTLRNATERVDPDPLLNTLESPETVSLLLDNIFDGEKSESAIVGGIKVLLALLDVNKCIIQKSHIPGMNPIINDEAIDIEHKEKIIQSTIESIRKHLKNFNNLLLDPPKKLPIKTTLGVLEQPLGNTRLQVTTLFATIISSNNSDLLQDMISLGTFTLLLDLFFKYPWNNFLHTQVENCLVSALKTQYTEEGEEKSNALSSHLLVNCKLIEKILDAWKDNDEKQKVSNNVRQGYMGHLINILNKILELFECTTLGQFMNDNLPEVAKTLEEFKDTTLKDTNTVQISFLGGAYPNTANENNDEYADVSFPQEQMYTHYQMQHLTSHCIDGYSGFNDDAFNDGDDILQTAMNFDLSDGDLGSQQEFFKQICSQTINTLDDSDDQTVEDKDHTFQTVIEKGDEQNDTAFSSDSDDENSPTDVPMDVDPWLSSKSGGGGGGKSNLGPIGSTDPWGGAKENTNPEANAGSWADFSSINFDGNFAADPLRNKNNIQSVATDLKSIVENDLKVESIEIEPKTTNANSKEDSKNDKSIDDKKEIAQDNNDKDAAGDFCQIKEADTENKAVSEPSNPSLNDTDQCLIRNESNAATVPDKKDV